MLLVFCAQIAAAIEAAASAERDSAGAKLQEKLEGAAAVSQQRKFLPLLATAMPFQSHHCGGDARNGALFLPLWCGYLIALAVLMTIV